MTDKHKIANLEKQIKNLGIKPISDLKVTLGKKYLLIKDGKPDSILDLKDGEYAVLADALCFDFIELP